LFGFQWAAPILIALWWFFVPGAGNGGWATVLMLFVAPIVLVMLLVPAIIVVSRPTNRRLASTAAAYGWAAPVLWLVALVPPAFLEGASDMRSYPSLGELVFGLSSTAASWVIWIGLPLFLVTWVAAVVASALPTARADAARAESDPS
jgi:hypothetical protein